MLVKTTQINESWVFLDISTVVTISDLSNLCIKIGRHWVHDSVPAPTQSYRQTAQIATVCAQYRVLEAEVNISKHTNNIDILYRSS